MELKIKATVDVNDTWADNYTATELCEAIRDRLNSSLGFRGDVCKLEVSTKDAKAVYKSGSNIKKRPIRKKRPE